MALGTTNAQASSGGGGGGSSIATLELAASPAPYKVYYESSTSREIGSVNSITTAGYAGHMVLKLSAGTVISSISTSTHARHLIVITQSNFNYSFSSVTTAYSMWIENSYSLTVNGQSVTLPYTIQAGDEIVFTQTYEQD